MNFDAKAEELVSKIVPDPFAKQQGTEEAFVPGIVIQDLPEDEVIEVITTGYVTPLGTDIAKTFKHGSDVLGLFGEDYKDLVRLAERMQKIKTLRDRVSIGLLIDLIFKWITGRHQQTATMLMTRYVLGECEKELREIEVWIPVAMLNVQSDLQFGKVTLRTITKEMLDVWFAANAESAVGRTPEEVRQRLDDLRRELQGFAAASIRVFAEPRRASEIAFVEAERSVAVLRFFSPANRIPEMVSYCTLLGREHIEAAKQLIVQDGRIVGYSDQSVDKASPFWILDDEYIGDLEEAGLHRLNELLAEEKPTEYQAALLDALLLYSKCALAKEPADKLIAILVALESMLLKDSNEPIQQNLAERMAFLFKESAAQRRATKAAVIKAYGLRSSFIHHGRSIGTDEVDALREFMETAWTSFFALIQFSNTYTTKAQLFDKIEEMKMS
jgi:hypothetical protein